MKVAQGRFGIKNKIGKHKAAMILLAAVVTVVVLMILVRIPYALEDGPQAITVHEENGVYDLTAIEDFSHSLITLPYGSTFYPNVLLTPETIDSIVPESVDKYKELWAQYLSQRFSIQVPDDNTVYVLSFKLSGRHALRAYVNGEVAGQTGNPGTTKEETEVWENNLTCYASPQDGKIDIILNSAQFYHYKRGASMATLTLYQAVPGFTDEGLSSQTKGFLVMGALFYAAAFLFCLFLLQPGTKATLYFALACLTMVMREGLQSQAWSEFSWIPGNLSFMLEYFSVVLLTVFLTLYLGQNLIGRFWQGVKLIIFASSTLYAVCLLSGDSVFYTWVLKYYQAILIACIVTGVAGLYWTMRRPTGEQAVALYGIAVFYLAVVGDILMYNNLFGDMKPNAPVTEIAMLAFVLAQSISLFLMHNRLTAEAREAERKLTGEKEMLEGLNRMKTEFLGNISHELKTPLTVVSGNIQHARDNLPPHPGLEETDRVLRLIDGEAARMAMMVSQLLDISRIDEGRMAIEGKKESLVEIVQSTLDNYYPYFTKNHNRLIFKREGVPLVWCDRNRVIQVLVNLITNAARHTRQGEITISVKAAENCGVIIVSDTGDGIEAERIPRLFERYHSRRPSDEKNRASWDTGTGLGLYICRYIVEAHGGSITVASEPGRGTEVTITLPLTESLSEGEASA